MTIQRKLLVLLLAAASAPVVIAGVLSYRTAERALSAAIDTLHTRSAVAEAEYAAAYVDGFAEELSVSHEGTAAFSPSEAQQLLTRIFLRRDGVSVAALLDAAGQVHDTVFVDDPEAFARQEPQLRRHDTVSAGEARDFYGRAAALLASAGPAPSVRRRALVSQPYVTQVRGRPAVAVVAPALAGQKLSLAAELMLDELAAHARRGYEEGTRVLFLDSGGRVFFDSGGALGPALFGGGRPAEGIAELQAGGTRYQAASARVGPLGWTAVVARPRAGAVAPLRALFRSSGLVLAAALLLVWMLARVLSRALAKPVAALAQGALEFSRGNLSHRIALARDDELGRLARTFNEMGRSIEDASRKLVRFNEELQAQVEERTRELRSAQQQLLRSQRLSAMGDLSAGLAHEVNNPLAVIVGNAELLQVAVRQAHPEAEGLAASPAREMVDDILQQALRISDIVRDLQSLSEAQRGGLTPVDVHQVLDSVLEGSGPNLAGISVSRRFTLGGAAVLGDAPALRELFGHLLSNAVNAVRDRPERSITFSTSRLEGAAVKVAVSDTGRGIPAEHLDRIFNPFFTTKQSWTGKGLALSICHRIVENHGGKISVQSEEGMGTTVTVVFPAAPSRPYLR